MTSIPEPSCIPDEGTKTVVPSSQADVADIVCKAFSAKEPIYTVGGSTVSRANRSVKSTGTKLCLGKLSSIIDYPTDDMTITVEAGLTVTQLRKRLAASRQWLPIDVPDSDKATVGGIVAADVAGPRQYAHGTLRDYVIGLTAVDGRGTVFHGGGRVVKNAAGYDVCKLMTGSRGTLGVITQVTFMVRPMPEKSAMLACDVVDFDMAERLLSQMVHTKTLPAAIEMISGKLPLACPGARPLRDKAKARLLVGVEGNDVDVAWMSETMRQEWEAAGIEADDIFEIDQVDAAWQWLTNLGIDLRIDVRPSDMIGLIEQLEEIAPDCLIAAHAGNGILRVTLPTSDPTEFARLVREEIRPLVAKSGGNMVIMSWPDSTVLTPQDIWGPPSNGMPVMRAMKQRFDPAGILNPGQFVFE